MSQRGYYGPPRQKKREHGSSGEPSMPQERNRFPSSGHAQQRGDMHYRRAHTRGPRQQSHTAPSYVKMGAPTNTSSSSYDPPPERDRDFSESQSSSSVKKESHQPLQIQEHIAQKLSNLQIQQSIKLPKRPDRGGTCGSKINISVNCFDICFKDLESVMYFVEVTKVNRIDTKEDKKVEVRLPPREKRQLIQKIVETLPTDTIYDGGHIIYSLSVLPGIGINPVVKEIEIPDPLGRDQLIMEYRIMEVEKVNTSDIINFVENPNATSLNMPQESLRFLDCVLRTVTKQNLISLGRFALYNKACEKSVPLKLFSIYKGFISSVRPQWKIRINTDMTHKAFFTPGNLADVMYEKYGDNMMNYTFEMARDLRGIRVESRNFYKNKNGGTYCRRFTICGVSSQPANKLIIEDLKQSVADYFKEHHRIDLLYPYIPCVKVDQKRDVYLPMELLEILPYQPPTATKGDVASEVIRCAAVRPQERFKEICSFISALSKSNHPLIKSLDLKFNPTPVELTARVLPTPNANFGISSMRLKPGSWSTNSFYVPAMNNNIVKWAILAVPPNNQAKQHIQMVSKNLISHSNNFGIRLDVPQSDICSKVQLIRKFKDFVQKGIDFLLFILYEDSLYSTIKRLGDLETGMRTQCVRGQTLRKPNVIPNILLKLNGKLGGVNWTVPDLIKDRQETIMVFGADVTHPAPTQSQHVRKSIAAIIGSISPDLMRYGVVVRQQATTEKNSKTTREIIDDMTSMIVDLLKVYPDLISQYDHFTSDTTELVSYLPTYYTQPLISSRKVPLNNNGRFPTRIIFYRDGVSEGQFESALIQELAALQRACSEIRPGEQPAMTYIVVQKRHHIRFKPDDAKLRNVPPGTVVDTEVTHPREFDFYLCSQDGIQGTSKPAHYYVLYDDSDWKSDALQLFTYFLCHAYMRCSRTVSYPAPTYYSHLAAFRARDWISDIDKPTFLHDNGRFRIHPSQDCAMFYL